MKLYDRKIEYLKSIGYNRYLCKTLYCDKFKKGKKIIGIDNDVLDNKIYFKVFKRIVDNLIKE